MTYFSHPLFGNLQLHHYLLPNGLNVSIVPDATTPIFSYQTWFKVGSAQEPAGRQGLAHLFEHMMFRQTKKRKMGEWERTVNLHGGTGINAYTSRDQTVYYFSFPNDKLSIAAELESDRMENLDIEPDMFETEKGAVLTERNRGLDDPGRFLWEELYKLTFTVHPYRYSIIGEENSIRSFTVEEATRFYKNNYAPQNALIIVVGDIEHQRVINQIQEQYGMISGHQFTSMALENEPQQDSDREMHITHAKARQNMMGMTWHIPGYSHDDAIRLSMLARLLAGHKTSELYERLVNTGEVSQLYVDASTGNSCGTFEMYFQLTRGTSFRNVVRVVQESIEKVANGEVSEEQLMIAKNILMKDYYQSIISPSALARLLGEGFIYTHDAAFTLRKLPEYGRTSLSELSQVSSRYLLDGFRNTVYLEQNKE